MMKSFLLGNATVRNLGLSSLFEEAMKKILAGDSETIQSHDEHRANLQKMTIKISKALFQGKLAGPLSKVIYKPFIMLYELYLEELHAIVA